MITIDLIEALDRLKKMAETSTREKAIISKDGEDKKHHCRIVACRSNFIEIQSRGFPYSTVLLHPKEFPYEFCQKKFNVKVGNFSFDNVISFLSYDTNYIPLVLMEKDINKAFLFQNYLRSEDIPVLPEIRELERGVLAFKVKEIEDGRF